MYDVLYIVRSYTTYCYYMANPNDCSTASSFTSSVKDGCRLVLDIYLSISTSRQVDGDTFLLFSANL